MTKQQVRALCKAIAMSESPVIQMTEYATGEDGKLHRKQLRPHAEAERLFQSEDFKLGWKEAHAALADRVQWVISASNADLIKFAGKAR